MTDEYRIKKLTLSKTAQAIREKLGELGPTIGDAYIVPYPGDQTYDWGNLGLYYRDEEGNEYPLITVEFTEYIDYEDYS